jgi:hypothetical protein
MLNHNEGTFVFVFDSDFSEEAIGRFTDDLGFIRNASSTHWSRDLTIGVIN